MRTLVIGDKRWSSWSMRPWLALKQGGIEFHELTHIGIGGRGGTLEGLVGSDDRCKPYGITASSSVFRCELIEGAAHAEKLEHLRSVQRKPTRRGLQVP